MRNYLGQYYSADSLWHEADPRCKLAVLLMFFAALLALSGSELLVLLGLTLALYRSGRLPWRCVGAVLGRFKILLLLTFIANWWFSGLEMGLYPALVLALRIWVKLVIALLVAAWFCLVTKPLELIDGWAKILKPLHCRGLSAEDWALFLGLVLRFVAELGRKTEQIILAQRLRGIKPGGMWRQGSLWVRSTLIPVFLATFRHAGAVTVALEARGYRPGQPRSAWRELRFKTRDWLITLCSLAGTLYFLILMIW